jgi:putative hydrolase of the HAD superfamily
MKPHPEAFRAALAALGVTDPGRAVFVGDRPFDDIHGARRSGLRPVLRRSADVPPYDVEPDATIDRLPELLPLLDGWRASAANLGR